MANDRKPLPRTIRRGRHFFFDDPSTDKLVAMLLALSGEVWVLRERLAAIEGVAQAAGTFTSADVERHQFSPDELEQLGALRREFIGNLFRVLDERVDAARAAFDAEAPAKPARKARRPAAARKSRKTPARKVRKESARSSKRGSRSAPKKQAKRSARRVTRPPRRS